MKKYTDVYMIDDIAYHFDGNTYDYLPPKDEYNKQFEIFCEQFHITDIENISDNDWDEWDTWAYEWFYDKALEEYERG